MSNPLTIKTKEALWDDRQDLDLDMAALYAINAQAELNRLAIAQDLDQTRMAHVHSLYVRYRTLSLQGDGNVVTFSPQPGLSRPLTGVRNQRTFAAFATTNQDPHISTGSESEISKGPPDTRDGVPRCFNHPHNRRATYHLPSECRALSKPQIDQNNEESRRQEEQARQQLARNRNNNQANLRNHTNNGQIDYPQFDYRSHRYHEAPNDKRDQDRRRRSRSLSPRTTRRHRY